MPSIDFFLRSEEAFSKEHYVAARLKEALTAWDATVRTHRFSDSHILAHDPPDLALLLSPVFPGSKPLTEAFGVPHFFWSLGPLASAIPYIKSTWGIVAHYTATSRFPSVHPLPPGVDPALATPHASPRPLDYILFDDLVDPHHFATLWEGLFEPHEIELIKAGSTLEPDLFFCREEFDRAHKTLELVQRFKNFRLDMFGCHIGNNLLRAFPHVYLHCQLPYTEHFEILKMSKYLVCHEESPWILPAWACGCRPIHHPDQIASPDSRQEEVLQNETWHRRAENILDLCASIF